MLIQAGLGLAVSLEPRRRRREDGRLYTRFRDEAFRSGQ